MENVVMRAFDDEDRIDLEISQASNGGERGRFPSTESVSAGETLALQPKQAGEPSRDLG
jgi:hypothetical protein